MSTTKTIVVSDIFGSTPALLKLADQISANVEIIDPYNAVQHDFKDDTQAYEYFSVHVGIESYQDLVKAVLDKIVEPVKLVGFSVGAAVLWHYLALPNNKVIEKAWLFYGGQIRHKTNLIPNYPTKLIFAKSEEHFDVIQLANKLNKTENLDIEISSYFHGFMNEYSKNYNENAVQIYLNRFREEF